ncbi:MAG: hypothetical protein J7641_13160 [Cyanobacteria bacterium SID2]|nr:hypothetical protein [Cyanobacteria bacterium SID2]
MFVTELPEHWVGWDVMQATYYLELWRDSIDIEKIPMLGLASMRCEN